MTILFCKHFQRQLKQLQKKYPRIGMDVLKELYHFKPLQKLSVGPSVYKIRIKGKDILKGKSGGFRCYLYFFVKMKSIAPVCIYAKSAKENITKDELQQHIDRVFEEIVLPV